MMRFLGGIVGGGKAGSPSDNIYSSREVEAKKLIRDDSLGEREKSRELTKIFMAEYSKMREGELSRKQEEVQLMQKERSFKDKENSVLGCEHYSRKVKIRAECCGLYFPCRFCHDEASDHVIDRFQTKSIMCLVCLEEQPVAGQCRSCQTVFARFYCEICRLYDDAENKDIYHCNKCGLCRVGKGVGVDVFHCDKCCACVTLESRETHKCLENCLQVDCPICGEFLFTSTQPGIFMKCGHTMHAHCYAKYIESEYRCPFCFKSILETETYIEEVDRMLAEERMPVEYASVQSHVMCNDCEERSFVQYHYHYHKCQGCGGYNTRVLGTSVACDTAVDTNV